MNPALGGVVEAINQAAIGLNHLGHEVTVLTFDHPDDLWVCEPKKYKVVGIGNGHTSYAFKPSYIKWLLNNAKDYDFVILDGLWQFHVFGGYILKLLSVPFGVYTHGMLDPYFNENKLKYLKKLPFWLFVERNVIALANVTLFTCEEEKLLAQNSFPFYSSTPKIATLGVNLPSPFNSNLNTQFYDKYPHLMDKRLGLFLSRINKKKGIDLLLQAFAKLDHLPADFDLVIAGPDHDHMKVSLMKLCPKHLTKRIHWVGMLTGDIKWGAYQVADCFILPSHQENFGIVVAEALSTGTPVLITNKVNIWREIDAAKAGIVDNDDVEGITKLLNHWFKLTAEEKRDMANKAKICYQNNFSIESAVTELERVLLDVISTVNANES
jgi:glycosyltransferase involved in cell wall biosynthesis